MNGPQINEEPCFLTKQVNHRSSAIESDITMAKKKTVCEVFDHCSSENEHKVQNLMFIR